MFDFWKITICLEGFSVTRVLSGTEPTGAAMIAEPCTFFLLLGLRLACRTIHGCTTSSVSICPLCLADENADLFHLSRQAHGNFHASFIGPKR